ncbi:MAG: Rpn family recombination-promoting nuclease/putative transposase [Bacteroidia bacterium]|nr:Rpn family recombination-promoting nuclease/putative transposase [Bacteroidia bacterium]
MKFVDIKNDVAFRKIFGNENKKEILISFLNAVLKLEKGRKIKSVEILNPYQFPRIKGQKVSIIDVRVKDEKHNSYIVEMQITEKKGLDKRIQYYSAKGYANQIEKGDDYVKLRPMIFIGILDFKYLKSKNYLSCHLIMDCKTYEQKLNDFEFNFIELPKFTKTVDELDYLVDKWIYFIKNAPNLEIIPENVNDKGLKQAYIDADRHNWTKEELEEYEYAQMREQDERGQTQLAVERTIEKNIKKLYEKGILVDIIAYSNDISIDKVKKILNIYD